MIIQGLGPADLKIPLIYLLNRLQPSMKSLLQEVEYRKAARNLIAQALRDYLNLPCPRVAASFWLIQDLDALKKFFTMGQNQSKCNASQQTLVIHAFCQSKLGILHAMKNIKNFY